MGIRCANHVTPLYPQKLALTSPTGGGRSVGIVRSRTQATEFSFFLVVVVVVVVVVTKGLKKNLEAIPGKHSVNALQKSAVLGTSHIIWEVLQCNT